MTRRLCGPLAALLVVAGCASSASDDWPAPDPAQPVVDLLFVVASDLHSVDGRETVTFTPDREVCELVFRAWPNKPATAVEGNALEIADVRVDGTRALPVVHRAGAPADHPGTLVEVPLPRCVPPGETVRTELTFTLTLGEGTDERVGVSATGEAAWFATAFPMLAWQRGRGWATDPAVDVVGEMATSETFRLDGLTVVAPAGYEVLGTGAVTGTAERTGTGRAVHRFTDPAVRDVAVTVGDLDVVHRTLAGVRVHLGTPRSGTRASPDRWLAEVESAIRELTARLGPSPTPTCGSPSSRTRRTGWRSPGPSSSATSTCRRTGGWSCTRSPTCGSTGWSATTRPPTRGSTSPSPPTPRRSSRGTTSPRRERRRTRTAGSGSR